MTPGNPQPRPVELGGSHGTPRDSESRSAFLGDFLVRGICFPIYLPSGNLAWLQKMAHGSR